MLSPGWNTLKANTLLAALASLLPYLCFPWEYNVHPLAGSFWRPGYRAAMAVIILRLVLLQVPLQTQFQVGTASVNHFAKSSSSTRNVKFIKMNYQLVDLNSFIFSSPQNSRLTQDAICGDLTFSVCPYILGDLIQHLHSGNARFLPIAQTSILSSKLIHLFCAVCGHKYCTYVNSFHLILNCFLITILQMKKLTTDKLKNKEMRNQVFDPGSRTLEPMVVTNILHCFWRPG